MDFLKSLNFVEQDFFRAERSEKNAMITRKSGVNARYHEVHAFAKKKLLPLLCILISRSQNWKRLLVSRKIQKSLFDCLVRAYKTVRFVENQLTRFLCILR